ncbi:MULTISPECIES: MFS transporter [Deinococcus]|uniref:MFS transporter n=1 Tax=Deinococcus rufus TaxID=2136097 RepID=A0ABV7ZA50_9DEIO|nr:MFS transporter [Deinococcus sp. AB2017081]WQE95018.1 MFS transporter [Deinococcus sp. AB2017081]
MTVRDRLPIRAGTLGAVVAAAASLAAAEFVRTGLYLPYLGQGRVPQEVLGLPPTAAGLAWAAHFAADSVMRGPTGLLIARYGLRPVLVAGALLMLGAIALLPLAHSVWILIVIAALHGVGFSAMWPGTMNLTADAAEPGVQGRALTAVSMAVVPFVGISYFLFGLLRDGPFMTVYAVCLGALALSVACALLVPGRAVRGPSRVPTPPEERARILRRLAPLLPAALMQTLTLALFGGVLFKLLDTFSLPYWQLVTVLAVGAGVAFACLPVVGKVADRGRARFTLTLGFGLIGVGLLAFAFTPPGWTLFLLAAVVGLGYSGVQPGWGALVTATLPEAQRPAAWGVLMTVENIGTALGPVVGAFMFQHYGAPGLFGLGAALALATALFYLVFRRLFVPQPQLA